MGLLLLSEGWVIVVFFGLAIVFGLAGASAVYVLIRRDRNS
jgi:hypothetical protein